MLNIKKLIFFIVLILVITTGIKCTKNSTNSNNHQETPPEIINQNINQNTNTQDQQLSNNTNQVPPLQELERGPGGEDVNLNIPFQSQAPYGNWDMPWQEGCEEASVILAVAYLRGKTSLTADEMNEKILTLVEWQNKNWGGHHDLDVADTVKMIKGFYGDEFEVEIIKNFTWDDVKKALNQNWPIIAPTAGRKLNNPYYTPPGPIYHMLVIKGYTENEIITNDVGTKRGADYKYSYEALYNGIHDWNNGDVDNGGKDIIILRPRP